MATVQKYTDPVPEGSTKKPTVGYEVRWRTPQGDSRRKRFAPPKGGATLTECKQRADAWAVKVEASKLDDVYVDPRRTKQTLRGWWEEWWPTIVDLRDSTRARDESCALNHIVAIRYDPGDPRVALGGYPLGKIDEMLVRRWVKGLETYGLAPSSIKKHLQLLGKILDAAARLRRIVRNPTVDVEGPSNDDAEPTFFADHQTVALVRAFHPRYKHLIRTGLTSSLRIGELAGLAGQNIDQDRGGIHVAKGVTVVRGHLSVAALKTKAARRFIPLPASVMAEMPDVGPLQPVFPAPAGGWLRPDLFRRRFWQPAAVAAGVGRFVTAEGEAWESTAKSGPRHYDGATPHAMRHTGISWWIDAGWDALKVKLRAGHRSIVTTYDIYGHLIEAAEGQPSTSIDERIAATWYDGPLRLVREIA